MKVKTKSDALNIFKRHGGILRLSEAHRLGVHPATLYQMRDAGVIDQVERGLYAVKNLAEHAHPDLVIIAKKVPHGVVCLISALYFHHLTTQIPHYVYVAIEQHATAPVITYPPTHFFWFSGRNFTEGVETHIFSGIKICCYNPEKTIVDCFRYRNKIGLDVALEALRNYLGSSNCKIDKLREYATIARVAKIMKPYIEAILE